jgi:hypothetical protein
MPDPGFATRTDPFLGGTRALTEAMRFLGRQPGLASWFRQWARMEAHAINLCTYECRLVPGLLQTEAYAQHLFANQLPPLSDEQITAQWLARHQRSQLLSDRPNTTFSFILEEHIFLRRTGGPEVTAELIDHILEMADERNIEVQIMPLICETHAGLDGPMRLLETPENRWYAYCEGQESGVLMSDSKIVSMLQTRYARMRSQALSFADSKALLTRLRGAL